MSNQLAVRALAACASHVRAKNEIKRLTELIGTSLSACFFEHQREHPNTEYVSHLQQAYEFDVDEYVGRTYLDEADQLELLSDCPHCLAAHHAIQERKKAKKSLGAARRTITMIGKSAL